MAKAKKSHSRRSKKIPILATAGAAAYGLNAYTQYNAAGGGAPGQKALIWNTIGIDSAGTFHMDKFLMNITPPVVGALGSMGASKLGLNRYLAKVPLVKL